MSQPFTPEVIAEHGLTPEEYNRIVELLERHPSIVELGIFSVMWSEHCSYKSSRVHLKRLPTTGECVVQGPGENAGIVDIGEGYTVAFKIESHNHPSFIEPFQGAATGVGGILRDIFTMGARPIAAMNSLHFGEIDEASTRRVADGVVRGIGHYGNCFGVPTIGGEVHFSDRYDKNPLVNAFDTTNQINEAFVTMVNTSGTALVGSSFLGGADQEEGFNIAVDKAGSIYVTGRTLSNDFPVALPFQPTRRGVRDAFVSKVRFGRGVISSSFIGGNGNDFGKGIAVKGNLIYVAGETQSNNLLTTNGVIKPTSNASATNPDGFVAKILDTRLESVGIFRPNTTFSLTQSITNVIAQNATFTSPIAGQRGVSGDFDGDGLDSIGSFTNGTWKLRNSNFPIINLPAPLGFFTVNFGQAGDLPVVGDWNGDGIDTLAVFRPSVGQFFATNSLVANPPVDFTVTFGQNGDLPVAGDWNGDGIDTVGVYRPSLGNFFLTNTNDFNASVDVTAIFGVAEDLPFAGDFNGDGIDTISVFRPSVNTFFITNDNAGLATAFPFGQPTDQPIAGDWDGKPLP